MTTLCLILGDQLNDSISSLQSIDKDDSIVVMAELSDEASYVKHHKKKLILIFSAMRHFAQQLQSQGYEVHYYAMDKQPNFSSFDDCLHHVCEQQSIHKIVVTEPSEYRLVQQFKQWSTLFSIDVNIIEDDRFLCDHQTFLDWKKNKKQLRMEFFYREMRKQHRVLLDDSLQPIGGQWNYDSQNRKPANNELLLPAPFQIEPDEITEQVIEMVELQFNHHFGDSQPFHFAVTRSEALQILEHFVQHRLGLFGDFQDAMLRDQPWMWHSHISFYLNCGLLVPKECINRAEAAYHAGTAPLNAVEGFIRQILGWREFIRGIYWSYMPDYKPLNYFNATRSLPGFYWTANTKMECLRQSILQTKQHAYAHHIQRLMVLGNFALLAGIDPEAVNEWFMIVYADAYEWVELPNVTGMALFADGGIFASKPYAAGGNYINKMSNYCHNCHYKVNIKTGDKACPFNYLYWDFLVRNQQTLKSNQRLSMIYSTLSKMSDEKKHAITDSAHRFLALLN